MHTLYISIYVMHSTHINLHDALHIPIYMINSTHTNLHNTCHLSHVTRKYVQIECHIYILHYKYTFQQR